MRVSLEWLREYVDIEMSAPKLADALSLSGTAVDRMIHVGGGVTGVVVGEVLEVKAHPDADALKLAVVNDGEVAREIVCGAPNLRVGMKSPFAREGAMLPAVSSKPLKKARIRGVESTGMLLAGDELGISEDHSGILELPEDAVPGTDLHKLMSLEDVVFELEITPNRPDCMCVYGVAREVSALTGAKLRPPSVGLKETGPGIDTVAKVVLEDPIGCPRYTARVVLGVECAPSPPWMQRRLWVSGLRPISNVVDVTNYVLLELGQPLHAFDMEILAEKTIIVRRAASGERMTTLDGVERIMDRDCLVIADAKEPVALAGIIGGEDSEVKDTTTDILIESAHFDPTSILLTSKRLGVRTEASGRFERGVDPRGTSFAAARAAHLMNELAGGQVVKGEIDEYPSPVTPSVVKLRPERANEVIGTDIASDEMAKIFDRLGAEVKQGRELAVTVPTWRPDLEREIDLVEEVARIHGYDRIPETVPGGGGFQAGLTPAQEAEVVLRESLVASGMSQVMAYSFMSADDLDRLEIPADDPRRRLVTLMNPLAETGDCMRTTLLPGLLRIASGNANRGNHDLSLFELGRTFMSGDPGSLPEEAEIAALLLTGAQGPTDWSRPAVPVDYFDIKGIVEGLAEALAVPGLDFIPGTQTYMAAGLSADVFLDETYIGYIGQVHPRVATAYELEGDVFAGELKVARLTGAATPREAVPVGRFPNVKVDLAVILDEAVEARTVLKTILDSGAQLLASANLFDVYRGPQIGAGKKSLAYALEFGSVERTLTDEQAHREMDRVIKALESRLGAAIRGREQEGETT